MSCIQRICHSLGVPARLAGAHGAGERAAGASEQCAGRRSGTRRRARDLAVACRQPCLGIAVALAAPLLAGTANALAATSSARYAPVVAGCYAVAPDAVPAVSPASFPGGAVKTDGMAFSDRASQEMISPHAHGHNAHAQGTTPTAASAQRPASSVLAPMAVPHHGGVTPLQVNRATRLAPPPSPALSSKRYPRTFIEWKLSARPSQQFGAALPSAPGSRRYPRPFIEWKLSGSAACDFRRVMRNLPPLGRKGGAGLKGRSRADSTEPT